MIRNAFFSPVKGRSGAAGRGVLCLLLAAMLSANTITYAPGDTATLTWSNGWSFCETCELQAYAPGVTFEVITLQDRKLIGIIPWFDKIEHHDVGIDTSFRFLMSKNTAFCVRAFNGLYSSPSDTCYGNTNKPDEAPDILLNITADQIPAYFKVESVRPTLDDRGYVLWHHLDNTIGTFMRRVSVSSSGRYAVKLYGWRYVQGNALLSVDDYADEIIFTDHKYIGVYELDAGTHEIRIDVIGTALGLTRVVISKDDLIKPDAPAMIRLEK